MNEPIIVGIDLGTTNSCVAYLWKGKIEILENAEGGRVTPSYIFFSPNGNPIVGHYAKVMANSTPENGIYEVKRFIGRSFNDPNVLKYFSFNVKNISDLCALILKKIKNDTDAKLGFSVDQVVLTVPAYFNNLQRKATMEAAKLAGFTVLKLLNEPTAVALNYYFENPSDEKENYSLVYDLGGGTFDVAILKFCSGNIETIAVDGDSHLGGHDFDNLIMDHLLETLRNKYKCDPRNDKRSMRRLQQKSEEAKNVLSVATETVIVLEGFYKTIEVVEIWLTRQDFENMAHNLFDKTISIVDRCLANSKMHKKDISAVILAGGSTRIPKIQSMLSEYFDGKAVVKCLNPDECVAKGAAVQAALLSKHPWQETNFIEISQVIPLSLGLSSFGNKMVFLIEKNYKIPISQSVSYTFKEPNDTTMTVQVYEGERTDCRKNYYLGECTIKNLTPLPADKASVIFTMSIDQHGILTVSAQEIQKTNNTAEMVIDYTSGHLSEMEAQNSIRNAARHEEEDKRFVQFVEKKRFVHGYCRAIIYNIEIKKLKNTYKPIYERCKIIKKKIIELEMADDQKVRELEEEVLKDCDALVSGYKFSYMPDY